MRCDVALFGSTIAAFFSAFYAGRAVLTAFVRVTRRLFVAVSVLSQTFVVSVNIHGPTMITS